METFVWDQNFITGLPQVDDQHHALVDLFNELNQSLFDSPNLEDHNRVLDDIFQRLLEYTRVHFSEEEQLMQDEGLEKRHIDAHRGLHKSFVEQMNTMWARRHEMSDPAETFVGFLVAWLGLHILGIDQSMARQIAMIRSGCSPAEAFAHEQAWHDKGTQALLKMIGRLYHVLSQQNAELAQANLRLEERVAQRTRELNEANENLRQANLQLEVFSRTDGLLKIANRACFDDRLADACASAYRRRSPLGLLMIDVDFFKRYNDRYGHQAGDACLQAVARAVSQAMLRVTDLVARYGGEELAVILPDTDAAGVAQVAARVVDAVARLGLPHAESAVAPHVTISVGATSRVPSRQDAGAELIAAADLALYRAKHEGRNRWVMSEAVGNTSAGA